MIIGAVGLVYIVERHFVQHPTVPFKLLMNRTTLIGYFTTFVQERRSLLARFAPGSSEFR
jgi:hypothetical protein